jgi:hypothetical protein
MNKLMCCICKKEHKAVSHKFPFARTIKVDGKEVNTGYICLKCARNRLKEELKRQESLKRSGVR